MNPTSRAFRERDRTRVACVRLTGTILACLCLFFPRSASDLMAEEESPPSSSSQNSQTEGRPPEDKSREQKNKGARETRTGAKSTARPKPTPAPGAGKEPDATTAPQNPGGAGAKPLPPAPTPEPVFRFTDFDLEKFHRPVRKDEEAEDGEQAGTPSDAAGTTAGGTEAQEPRVKQRQEPRVQESPNPAADEPGPNPAKRSRNGEDGERSRQSQVQAGRQRISRLQDRLGELHARRDALANRVAPAGGQTESRNAPAKPSQPPPPIDVNRANDRTPAVKDLLRQLDDEIRSVEEEIESARSELASVEVRFAQDSRTR